ncbi:MAG: endonuclease domain-containing protein [Betaproteobacteria bacterium]|nr:endonuclease domain-containing protein [Betaproteobacteria bacterium]
MLKYVPNHKQLARNLRSELTDAEQRLWHGVRGKQILGVQSYRQRPIGPYIVDFHAPSVQLVVEVDGSQHYEQNAIVVDKKRTRFLESKGFTVLRFDNLQVLNETAAVLEVIHRHIQDFQPPSIPIFQRGKKSA